MPSTSGTMVSVSATVMGPRAKSTSSLPDLVIEVDYISFLSAAIPNASRTPKVEKMCKSIYPNSPLCDVDLGFLIAGVSASPSQWIKFGKRTAASLGAIEAPSDKGRLPGNLDIVRQWDESMSKGSYVGTLSHWKCVNII